MRDPLGLESVQPEQPKNGEDKEVVNIDEQQRGIIKRKRINTKDDQQHHQPLPKQTQRYSSPISRKSISKKTKDVIIKVEKEMEKEKEKMVNFDNCINLNKINNEEKNKRRKQMVERYRYGNFNNYHLKKEFRNSHFQPPTNLINSTDFLDDPRVNIFCPDWFFEKSVLDVGCNSGRFAITLAKRCQPRKVIGVDLDQHLIGAARKNIRHFADKDAKLPGKFPASFPANFGPISAPSTSSSSKFPDNVWFFCENYVLKTDEELEKVKEEFEIIFALSLTKWIHLNWGDVGIRRFFHRVFRQLKTGGRFVLETAPYKDYIKYCNKKGGDKPPDDILNNFTNIVFHPEEFTEFLLNTVGFNHHEELNTPQSKYLGISGRLQVFYKGKFMLTPKIGGGEIDLIVQQEKQQQISTNGNFSTTKTIDQLSKE
ncbi:Bin3-type SAM domain-containing protein [Meloidogyne graminicola]|uniref:RNA methyltransferase n=1 Tax=Meloidogyne graminicola TaxID=189291 RepID=A0A8T0A3B8_9BILA|nr:Bin3-type SAM domain-containing protein [Meloidogyne graminicola]